jgi:predicted kinase
MFSAGAATARLEASWNAEAFYVRQGYGPDSPRPSNDTRTFSKSLLKNPQLVQPYRPTIVMLAGLPGTGKTTLAYAIARILPFVVLDKDLVNTVLLNGALPQESAGPLAYEVLLNLAADLVIVQGRSVILDTAGRQPIILDRAKQIADQAKASLRVIRLIVPHSVRRERMAVREALPSQWTEDETTEADEAIWYSHLPADTLTLSSLGTVEELMPNVLESLLFT